MQQLWTVLGPEGSKFVIWIGVTLLVLIGLALVFWLLMRVFGRGLNISGNNGRGQPQRLGITGAFNVDRKGRKLVILRRDNVEHLVLIGGPNDVLVESNIIRAANARQPTAAATSQAGDAPEVPLAPPVATVVEAPRPQVTVRKEPAPTLPPRAAPVAPPPLQVPLSPAPTSAPPVPVATAAPMPAPRAPAPVVTTAAPVAAAPAPKVAEPVAPVANEASHAPQAVAASAPPAPAHPEPAHQPTPAPAAPAPARRITPDPRLSDMAQRLQKVLQKPETRPASGHIDPMATAAAENIPIPLPSTRKAEAKVEAKVAPAAVAPVPAAKPAAPAAATGKPLDADLLQASSVDSLEEEMARLLGRGPSPKP